MNPDSEIWREQQKKEPQTNFGPGQIKKEQSFEDNSDAHHGHEQGSSEQLDILNDY